MMNLRRMRRAGRVARVREEQNAYRVCVGKPEGKGPPVRHSSWWEDKIKVDLKWNRRVLNALICFRTWISGSLL
jgi:hypothetical protein